LGKKGLREITKRKKKNTKFEPFEHQISVKNTISQFCIEKKNDFNKTSVVVEWN
jgi:hypothetical protein